MKAVLRHPLVAIVVAGLALRVLWALLVPVIPVSDSAAYDTFARNIVAHGVYGWSADEPGAYWAVGPSAVAAATYLVVGESYLGIVLVNLAASLALIVLAARLGEIHFGPAAGLCAAALVAFWPNLILFTTVLASELWFIVLTMAGFWAWSRRGGTGWGMALLAGVFWAAACYMRPVILLFPVALVIAALPGGLAATLRQAGRALAAIAVILALVAPWTWRNMQVFGEPVLMSTNFGANFWMGNNPDTEGGYMPLPDRVSGLDEIERSDLLMEEAMDHVRAEPLAFVGRSVGKALSMHSWETIGVAWNVEGIQATFGAWALLPLKLASTGYWYGVLALALLGQGLLVAQRGFAGLFHPVFGGWAYFTAIHAIVVSGDRYHMPSVPFMALLGGLALAWLASRPQVVRLMGTQAP